MNIINFINRCPDEASCVEFIKEQRIQQEIICRKCSGSKHYYWLENKLAFQCAVNGFRTSIKSDIVMESSNLPIRIWMIAITYITATKKGFSTAELQRLLGMKRYEPVFRMYHNLCVVMGKREHRFRLEDMVEYDEAFVGKSTKAQVRSKFKRRQGTQKHSKVAVMVESTVLEDPESGRFDKSCRYFKMKKIKNLEAKTAQTLIKEYIDSNSVLQTDKSTTFSDLSDCICWIKHKGLIQTLKMD